jgi:hypothetical protein
MNNINGDIALSQYLPATGLSKKTPAASFQDFLASAATATTSVPATSALTSVTAPASAAPAASASFVSDLNSALRAYGITTPPSLRITSGPNGLALDGGDDRDANFQAMLKANPALQQTLGNMIGEATLNRKTALNQAMQSFGGANPSPTMSSFLDDFADSEKPKDISISFNGATASVQEMGDNGWEPVKDKSTFSGEMLAAYAKYLVKYGVSTEKPKDQDDTDADIDLKKQLAKVS